MQLTAVPGLTSGVELPVPDHSRLKARAKVNKRALKLEVLADVQAAEAARVKLLGALMHPDAKGHSTVLASSHLKRSIIEALEVLGLDIESA